MNSRFKFPRRVRIHGGECGAVARALHHKAKISSPAVEKNVFFTTFERKLMSKVIFKRISLAVISALTFGMLSSVSAPVANAADETFTLSASSASVVVGESATVTATLTFVSDSINGLTAAAAPDSRIVVMAGTSAGGSIFSNRGADSANVTSEPHAQKTITLASGGVNVDSTTATAASTLTRIVTNITFYQVATPGTYVYTFSTTTAPTGLTAGGLTQRGPTQKTATFTLTVTAPASSKTTSKFWMNRPAEYNAAVRTDLVRPRAIAADSTTPVSAGTVSTPSAAYVLWTDIRNSSDTATVYPAGTATPVRDSVTITISGPGLLAGHTLGTVGTRAKQVSVSELDTVIVYSDGTAGTATISAYLGTTISSATLISTKSLTFHGKATSFTVDSTDAVNAGSNVAYTGASDSVTAGTAIVRFVAKDSAGNSVASAALNTDPGEGAFYAISSDTSVIAAGSSTTARRSPALACTYSTADAEWQCSGNVYDSGTVTLTIVDSRAVTANGSNYLSTVSAPTSSTAFSVTFAGAGYTGTAALNKATYTRGEAALLTLTCKDTNGRNVANGTSTTCFTNVSWGSNAATMTADTSSRAAGGTFTDLATYVDGSGSTYKSSYVNGSDTAMVYMPYAAGTYSLKGRTAGATTDSVLLTFTVVDPAETAAAAAQSAADAATDAANEAIDAANAATDAANLAAEAADAATVAAEEARDAADAATAAVEELATQVATLMAALKAQITTLANTVAKIAKKVKA